MYSIQVWKMGRRIVFRISGGLGLGILIRGGGEKWGRLKKECDAIKVRMMTTRGKRGAIIACKKFTIGKEKLSSAFKVSFMRGGKKKEEESHQ